MKIEFTAIKEPDPVGPSANTLLTYNGDRPKYDLMFEGVWNAPGKEFLEAGYKNLVPWGHDPIDGDLDVYTDDLTSDLPARGVWDIVALGKVNGETYWTDCGYEHDMWVEWTIISANKFPSFGDLKHWFKKWKKDNDTD